MTTPLGHFTTSKSRPRETIILCGATNGLKLIERGPPQNFLLRLILANLPALTPQLPPLPPAELCLTERTASKTPLFFTLSQTIKKQRKEIHLKQTTLFGSHKRDFLCSTPSGLNTTREASLFSLILCDATTKPMKRLSRTLTHHGQFIPINN